MAKIGAFFDSQERICAKKHRKRWICREMVRWDLAGWFLLLLLLQFVAPERIELHVNLLVCSQEHPATKERTCGKFEAAFSSPKTVRIPMEACCGIEEIDGQNRELITPRFTSKTSTHRMRTALHECSREMKDKEPKLKATLSKQNWDKQRGLTKFKGLVHHSLEFGSETSSRPRKDSIRLRAGVNSKTETALAGNPRKSKTMLMTSIFSENEPSMEL